jgi:xylulokinase
MLLGIDVGTNGSRAVLVDARGGVVRAAAVEHVPFRSAYIGWAEQDPDDWWRAATAAVREVLAQAATDPHAVRAVGLTGQMHGAVVLGERDEVLRPCIIWCDQRSHSECRALTEIVGTSRLVELTCNPAIAGFTLPKLLWIRNREPDVWRRIRSVLLPKDYIRLRLTADRATDVADASGTLLFDVARRRWSQEMIEAAGVPAAWLPRAFEGPEVTGTISRAAAEATGLREGIPVVAGGGDQAAGAIGMGIVRPGAVGATIGTSGVVFAATDAPSLDPLGRVHTFCHAVPGRWHVMGVTQAAGLSLRWFRDRFGAGPDDGRDPYERLCEEAGRSTAGANGVFWAPYLMGERTPHLDAQARAALVGLSASHTRGDVIRAILEGVAFSLRDTFTILDEMRLPVVTVRIGGGGARSPLWRQIQADVYGRPVEILRAEEGAAYGAALLAGAGTGTWPTVEAACETSVTTAARVAPGADREALDRRYRAYREIYPALRRVREAEIAAAGLGGE